MEGTAVDSICISAYPTEQFIPQRNNTVDDNEKSIAEVGPTLDSASPCTHKGLSKDSGAGANAGTRTEITFVNNNPLSELVWSPHKGLSLKCADFSLAEKRSSLLWSTESGNMIVSPPQSLQANESDEAGTEAEGNVNSMQLTPNPNNEISDKGTSVPSPTTIAGITTLCQTSHGQNSRSCGDMEPLTVTMKVLGLDVNHMENDQSEKKEMNTCCPREARTIVDVCKDRTETAATFPDEASSPGPYNGRTAGFLQFKPKEPDSDSAPIEFKHGDSNKGASCDRSEESRDIGSGNIRCVGPTDILCSEVSTLKQHNLPKSPAPISERKHADSILAAKENNGNGTKTPKLIKLSSMERPESTAENDVQPSKTAAEDGSAFAEVGMIVIASQPEDEGKRCIDQNQRVPPMFNEVTPVEAAPYISGIHPDRRKGKEKALSDVEVNRAVSKEEDDSHESVESRNSGGLFSTGKRAWCFEQQLLIRSKKMKKQCHETQCSASFFGQDSSFMNYISNMMKGSPKFNPDDMPSLAITRKPTHHGSRFHDSLVISPNRIQDPSFRPMGFQSIFQALYCPPLRVAGKKTSSLDPQIDTKGPKELEVAHKIPCDGGSTHTSSDGEKNVKLLELIPISNPGVYQAGECPSTRPNVPSINIIRVEENPTSDFGENRHSCNVAHAIELGGGHASGSSLQNDSISPTECKGASRHDSAGRNKSSNSVTNRSSLFESLWITRFSPKVSAPVLNSVQCNPDMAAAIEVSTDYNRFLPHSQNVVFTVKGPNIVEDRHEPSTKEEMNTGSRNIQNYSVGPSVSCGSKRTMVHTDQKFKSKLSPILPSERLQNSEAMASVFARRLDALKHIKRSKATDSESRATTLCFFCGVRDHTLRDCSEVLESELDDLLKNINLYDGAEESSCLCIRCLQLNHWAIACPYASSRKQTNPDGNASLDRKRQLLVAFTNSHCESSREENEYMVHTDAHNKLTQTRILNGSISDLKPAKKDIIGKDCYYGNMKGKKASREFILNGKHASSSSKENGLKENQITPFNYVNRPIPDVPRGIFEVVRRLRLSRSDILKWMKSPVQNFPIEGFFLRLRLGKWEEGLGGTGYHVACISGKAALYRASQESSCGTCRTPISVEVGGFKCLVDCRYISNHDFIEDELMAWWCATLRGDGKLPSEEDLNMKLIEKTKFVVG
ncbi:uncharacterized protein LOC131232693 isoform X2 [Magnolia sinica]|uniref:uncharacterized protein LOC131232693 isoform X2 n=1 Tax=Magnolia sinica TaxID=86752 RepID=UPI002659E435|nr:uncharacterized protein LOC131232693 isoform X2 [Magnolia sinica]